LTQLLSNNASERSRVLCPLEHQSNYSTLLLFFGGRPGAPSRRDIIHPPSNAWRTGGDPESVAYEGGESEAAAFGRRVRPRCGGDVYFYKSAEKGRARRRVSTAKSKDRDVN